MKKMEEDSRREAADDCKEVDAAEISAEAPTTSCQEENGQVVVPSRYYVSRWRCRDGCCCHRAMGGLETVVGKYPRTCAIFCRILFPLMGLFFLAVMGGFLLGAVEAPNEIQANNVIAASRFVDESIDLLDLVEQLEDIPTFCLNYALNATIVDPDENITLFDVVNGEYGNLSDPEIANLTPTLVDDLPELVEECQEFMNHVIDPFINLVNGSDTSASSLDMTFDWTRCWNTTKYGDLKWIYLNDEALDAVKEQEEFYLASWEASMNQLLSDFWKDNNETTLAQSNLTFLIEDVLGSSLEDATGEDGCSLNHAGTVWFFFTVMTTIGYGNQAPATLAGRLIVVFFGFFCIIAFASVLSNSGVIMDALYTDFVKRAGLGCLRRPFPAAMVFMFSTAAWLFFVGFLSEVYWKDRLEPDEAPDYMESVWFAFISITTVGLGDLYLEPDVMFFADVVLFSIVFLLGFVLLASFLTQLRDVVVGKNGELDVWLEARLATTDMLPSWCCPRCDHDETIGDDPSNGKVDSKPNHSEREEELLKRLLSGVHDQDKPASVIEEEKEWIRELLALRERQEVERVLP